MKDLLLGVGAAITMLFNSTFTAEDVFIATAESRNPRELRCIFEAEIGGVGHNPHAFHSNRNVYGPGGLATFGLLPEFLRWIQENLGEEPDRYNPYQVARYIDWKLENNGHGNWPYLRARLQSGVC